MLVKFYKLLSKNISIVKRVEYREDINILRALAVISVVLYHAGFKFIPGGWLGVDIFFVISGFLISNIIISELNEKKFSFKNFYRKRVRRIIPALFSTLLITIPLAWNYLYPTALLNYGKSLLSSVFFYSNYYFNTIDFYNSEPSKFFPLLHTWSLAIEEQFYLILPGMLFVLWKYLRNLTFPIVTFLLFVSIYLNTTTGTGEKFYLFEYRAWELLLGVITMIISFSFKIKYGRITGFILIIFSVCYFDDLLIIQTEPKLLANLGAVLILLSSDNNSVIKSKMKQPLLLINRIGLISYSMYLLHQPLFAFSRIYFRKNMVQESLVITFLLLLALFIVSNLQYELIEKVFLQKNKLTINYIYALFPILFFSLYALNNDGVTPKYKAAYENVEVYFNQDQRGGIDLEECKSVDSLTYCTIGNKNLPSIVLIGDSHITTLSNYLYKNIDFKKYNLILFQHQGCPFFLTDLKSSRASCGNKSSAKILRDQITKDSIVIYGGRFTRYFTNEDFNSNFGIVEDNIAKSTELLNDVGVTLKYISENSSLGILIYPIPELGFQPLEYILENNIKENLYYDRAYWDAYSKEVNEFFDEFNFQNLKKVRSDEIFCNNIIVNKCTIYYQKSIYYWDNNHLTFDGAKLLGDEIFNIINSL